MAWSVEEEKVTLEFETPVPTRVILSKGETTIYQPGKYVLKSNV